MSWKDRILKTGATVTATLAASSRSFTSRVNPETSYPAIFVPCGGDGDAAGPYGSHYDPNLAALRFINPAKGQGRGKGSDDDNGSVGGYPAHLFFHDN